MNFHQQLRDPHIDDQVLFQAFLGQVASQGVISLGTFLKRIPGKLVRKLEFGQEVPFLLRIKLANGTWFHVFIEPDGEGWHTHPIYSSVAYILAGGYTNEWMEIAQWKTGVREPNRQPMIPGHSYVFDYALNRPGDREIIHRVSRFTDNWDWSVSLFRPGERKPEDDWSWAIYPVEGNHPIPMGSDPSRDTAFECWTEVSSHLPGGLFL